MKMRFLSLVLFGLAIPGWVFAGLIYDNTTTDTLNTLLYSAGSYSAIGDQIHLSSAGNANGARVQMFNGGSAGTFDAQLRFYEVGAVVGPQLGATYSRTGLTSAGGDVINIAFSLGSLAVPQDLVFAVTVSNVSAGMDLGLNLFQPPAVGSSDSTFLIANKNGFAKLFSANENVFFQLSVLDTPEPGTLALLGAGALAGIWRRFSPQRSASKS